MVVLAAAVVVAVADLVLRVGARPPLLVAGVLDEAAHAATATLVVLVLRPLLSGPTAAAAVVAAVLVDVDHVPGTLLGQSWLTDGVPRPYPHSLLTVALLAAGAVLVRARGGESSRRRRLVGRLLAGAALGVTVHLARDLATGPGVALGWPLSSAAVTVPYVLYAGAVAALAVAGVLVAAGGRGRVPASPPTSVASLRGSASDD